MSLRSTARIADISRSPVVKLLTGAGKACSDCQDQTLRGLPCKRIQCDETWASVYARQNTLPRAKSTPPEVGDVWTGTAMGCQRLLADFGSSSTSPVAMSTINLPSWLVSRGRFFKRTFWRTRRILQLLKRSAISK